MLALQVKGKVLHVMCVHVGILLDCVYRYIIHESACWSPVHKKWYFLPRRASQERYNDVDDEQRATNLMITADADLSNIATSHIGVSVISSHL